jgi:replicative DNA helicase
MQHERALLAAILNNNDIYYQNRPKKWWFTDGQNRAIFYAIENVIAEGAEAREDTVGMKYSPSAVAEVADSPYNSYNITYYMKRCKRAGMQAELAKLPAIISDDVKGKEPEEVISEIEDYLDRLTSETEEHKVERAGDKLVEVIDDIEERYNRKGELPGITTGFGTIDDMLMGLQDRKYYLIGARPSQGKSALMLNMASNIADHMKVGIISAESDYKEVLVRELASLSKVNSQSLMSGYIGRRDFDKLTEAAELIDKKGLYLYDKPNCTFSEVRAQARRMVHRHSCRVIFIDYLQLIRTGNKVLDQDLTRRVATVSTSLKNLSRELGIPVVALAQIGRQADGRRPTLGDFQWASQIEQDADAAILLYWRVTDKNSGKVLQKNQVDDGDNEELQIYALIDKARDGRKGAVPLVFHPEYVTFHEQVDSTP